MNILLNNTRYTPRSLPRGEGPGIATDLSNFLDEWYNNDDHVTGHTSGSTGPARRVPLLKRDMLASAALTNACFGITSRSTLLLCLSPDYIAGKMMITRAILAGASLVAVEPSANPLLLLSRPVDLAAMVPLQLEKILSSPDGAARLSLVRQLIIGGAALSPALERRLQEIPTSCHASYGMTETLSHVALRRVNGSRATSCYASLGDTRFSTDPRGCLVIDAPHLEQRRFITNDLVHLLDERHFHWLGRVDNIINSGGIKISPENLEKRIAPLILPLRYYITATTDNRPALVIESEPWEEPAREKLLARLSRLLSSRETPRVLHFVPRFRETPSGKVLRDRLVQ